MSGHEFERQVRQKLDDLKLTPTSQVWVNIEEGLRERRRRPAVIYWAPLLAVALTAGGYFLFNQQGKPENLVVLKEKNHSLTEKGSLPQETSSHKKDASSKVVDNDEGFKESYSEHNLNSNRKESLSEKTSTQINNVAGEVSVIDNSLKENLLPGKNTSGSTSIADQQSKEDFLKGKNPFLTLALQPAGSPTQNHYPLRLALANEKTSLNNSTRLHKPSKLTSNKWSYGLSASGGISAVNEGKLIAFNNATVEDVSTVAPFAPQQPYTPSSISPGITYSLGGFVQRILTKKLSLSVGLSYLQLNTHNKVGNEINSRAIVNNGNRGFYFVQSYFTIDQDNTREYRNRYHFVELPVELHLNINKSKKLPMYVNTGMSVSRLIKSNSLHFDGTTGVYYRNDKLINRTQVATSAGFAVGLLNKTTRPIQVGPTVRYNVTKILQKDVSARTNFMSFGIDARMFIK